MAGYQADFKIKDVVRMATITPRLTPVHMDLLQGLMVVLLRKQGCDQDKVIVSGQQAKLLREQLQDSKQKSFIAFDDPKPPGFIDDFEKIDSLQHNVESIDRLLDRHVAAVHECEEEVDTTLDLDNWNFNPRTEITISLDCTPVFAEGCSLLQNDGILRKSLRRVASYMVNELFVIELQIAKFGVDLQMFNSQLREEFKKIYLLQACIHEINVLTDEIDINGEQFLSAMEEVQDMLDSKLDAVHFAVLHKYIEYNLKAIWASIRMLQNNDSCPKPAGIILGGIKCLCCGNPTVGAEVGNESTGVLKDCSIKPGKIYDKHLCIDEAAHYGKNSKITDFELHFRRPWTRHDEGIKAPARKLCVVKDEFIVGTNGKLYRGGHLATDKVCPCLEAKTQGMAVTQHEVRLIRPCEVIEGRRAPPRNWCKPTQEFLTGFNGKLYRKAVDPKPETKDVKSKRAKRCKCKCMRLSCKDCKKQNQDEDVKPPRKCGCVMLSCNKCKTEVWDEDPTPETCTCTHLSCRQCKRDNEEL